MNKSYPIMLQLNGRKVVVAGGGKVAERKVDSLLDTGAKVLVVSPEVTEKLKQLAMEGKIILQQRSFSADDVSGAFLIFGATNDKEVNQLVRSAASDHQLVTIADDPEESDFHVPAHFKQGRLSIAVSTGGASPILASKIREQLEQQFDETYEEYLEFLFTARQLILREVEDPLIKRKLLSAIISPEFLKCKNREDDFQKLLDEYSL
jgi:precorrin-2 dehydrogenase/sirohydrochlorin ferrochelatase